LWPSENTFHSSDEIEQESAIENMRETLRLGAGGTARVPNIVCVHVTTREVKHTCLASIPFHMPRAPARAPT